MDTEEFQTRLQDTVLQGSTTWATARPAPQTLALHGGGQSTRHGYAPLLRHLASHGHSSVSFDFMGQGQSPGPMSHSSLSHRAEQALAVAKHWDMEHPRALIASSMGGHVACTLLPALRPRALVLYCPAAYVPAAQHLPFGPGFQQVLRASSDFANSPAFAALEDFEGRLLLIHGSEESVIPPQVEQAYAQRARRARSVEVLRLPGAGHHLHAWLQERPGQAAGVFARVLATLQDGG
jgi:alpha-beta hydrolase superfamily lysophospholipase